MESTNFHHQNHQLQDQLVGSSPLTTPSCYAVGTTPAWSTTPNTILNPINLIPNSNGVIINSRDSILIQDFLAPSPNSSMMQDLGIQWATTGSSHNLHFERLKGELSSDSYQKFTEMIHSSSSSSSVDQDFQLQSTTYLKDEHRDLNGLSPHEKVLLRNFSSGCQINNGLPIPAAGVEFYSTAQNCSSLGSSRGNFSQIFPTINISNLNTTNIQSSSAIPSTTTSFDMNMQALDLFTTSDRFSQDSLYKEGFSRSLDDHLQQSNHRLSNSLTEVSPFTSGGGVLTEVKRPSSSLEPKVPQAPQKKSRSDSRSSCPPFKVRKEKLGDRIAALQQLVAPFGKTDTASVLMEAIGYIKFLQNQVETLSVPYMKSSRNKTSRTMRGGSTEDGNEEPKRDLKSRGLCLVPLTCLSYVTDGGGGVWSTP